MPYKDKDKQKEAQRQHYLNNKEKYSESAKRRRRRNKKFVHNKKIGGCVECGESNIICLDFHHRNPKNKVNTLAQLIRNAVDINSLQKEIDKCDVVCANCHHKKHHKQITTGEDWKGSNKARIKKRKWFIDYISKQKCDCGEDDKRCLEHHHIKDKRYNISYLLSSGHSLKYLKEEISRCKVVCRNCHRKIHS